MFKKIGPNAVRSSDRFEVSRVSRFELLYKEGDHLIKIEVEPGEKLAVYQKSLKEKLTPDGSAIALTGPEVKRILNNVCKSLDFLSTEYTCQ